MTKAHTARAERNQSLPRHLRHKQAWNGKAAQRQKANPAGLSNVPDAAIPSCPPRNIRTIAYTASKKATPTKASQNASSTRPHHPKARRPEPRCLQATNTCIPNVKSTNSPTASAKTHFGLSHSSEKPLTGGKKQAANRHRNK